MVFEPWRANFICDLHENTKESVEIAEKHYLQSLIGTTMKREMKDFTDKYVRYADINEGNLKGMLDEVVVLERNLDLAMTELKKKSDEYYLISSHGYPFKVETMTYTDCKRAKLPDFSKFFYEGEMTSIGALSEKWESLKTRFDEEFVGIFSRQSHALSLLSLTSLRGDWTGSSSFSISEAGESEMNRSNSSMSSEKDDEHNSQDAAGDSEMPESKVVDDATSGDKDSAQALQRPTVIARRKVNISMDRPMSQISTSLLLKSAKMAENRRLLNSHIERPNMDP